jgi:hypothetical protein
LIGISLKSQYHCYVGLLSAGLAAVPLTCLRSNQLSLDRPCRQVG